MGSPVLAVIANLYMESLEEQAIVTSPYKPRVWKRYVDNTFTVLDRESILTTSSLQSASPGREIMTASLLPQFPHHLHSVKGGIVKCLRSCQAHRN